MDLAHASLAEIDVADRERFIHHQNLGVKVDRDGEGQANDHAAGISLDGLVDEVADLRERFDFGKAAIHFLGGETQNRAIQIDVVAAGEFRIESGAEFEQRGDASVDGGGPGGGLKNSGADLQQGALAGSVFADDTERLAAAHFEGNVAKGPVIGVKAAAIESREFLQTVAGRGINRVALGDARKFDGGSGHY